MRVIIFCLVLFLNFVLLFSQQFIGTWDGSIHFFEQQLKIKVYFDNKNDSLIGKIDIPQQNAFGLELSNIVSDNEKLHFELKAAPGNIAKFDGVVTLDSLKGLKISGNFEQMGVKGTFNLFKGYEIKLMDFDTPELLPYTDEEVTFYNEEIKLAGTLSVPLFSSPTKFPAVILITGSGTQTRDEDVFGFKIFKKLADSLARCGIAVLRYDDRGAGGSSDKEGESTTFDFATDVESAIKYLKTRDIIDHTKIGLLGHSEGGIIASIVASRSKDLAFVIFMAGTAIRGDSLLIAQIKEISKSSGYTDDFIQSGLNFQRKTFEVIRSDTGWENLRAEMMLEGKKQIELLPEEQKKFVTDSVLESRIDLQINSIKGAWFKNFIDINPADYIKKIKIPVFALFGELDTQVPPVANQKPMEEALKKAKNKKYLIKVYPKANHLFQHAITGNPNEYATLEKTFVNGFLSDICSWIFKATK